MSYKTTLSAFALLLPLSTPGFAAVETAALPRDTHFVFGEMLGSGDHLAEMSRQEMDETEGAVAPWVAGGGIGAIVGGGGYAYGVWKGRYGWDTGAFAGNVATGALAGATFGGAGALAGGGWSAGANIWRFNSFAFNSGMNRFWRRDCFVDYRIC